MTATNISSYCAFVPDTMMNTKVAIYLCVKCPFLHSTYPRPLNEITHMVPTSVTGHSVITQEVLLAFQSSPSPTQATFPFSELL